MLIIGSSELIYSFSEYVHSVFGLFLLSKPY